MIDLKVSGWYRISYQDGKMVSGGQSLPSGTTMSSNSTMKDRGVLNAILFMLECGNVAHTSIIV